MDFGTTSLPGLKVCFRAAPATSVGDSVVGNRLFVEAVIWKFRSGAPWRDLPERFGDWNNTHRRFSRWAEKGDWENLFKALAADRDNEYAMIDATIVRAHQHSAGALKRGIDQAIGRSRGGLTTKIHAIVDALGNPLAISLTGGQARSLGARRCSTHATKRSAFAASQPNPQRHPAVRAHRPDHGEVGSQFIGRGSTITSPAYARVGAAHRQIRPGFIDEHEPRRIYPIFAALSSTSSNALLEYFVRLSPPNPKALSTV